MLRIAIVEDEEYFARELEEYVRRYAAETFREVKITAADLICCSWISR